MKYQIGVIGSAEGSTENILAKARTIGRQIANYDCTLITGAATGLSYEAVIGAKESDGLVIGIAPAMNENEQIERFKFKREYLKKFDAIVFTGAGYKGRNVPNMRSCHAVILISGSTGTLNEFTIAYDEGKLIGVLTGTGGVADEIQNLEKKLRRKETSGTIIYNEHPKELVKELINKLSKT